MSALLNIEMIPKTCWGRNVRKVVSYDTWQKLRDGFGVFTRNCALCGCEPRSPLELHEEWAYDDERRTQRLVALRPICSDCHSVIHFGKSVKEGEWPQAMEHLMKVNGWSEGQVKKHVEQAFEVWERRSKINYELDLSFLQSILTERRIHLDWLTEDRQVYSGSFDAHHWARQMISSEDVVILDTETTGLPQLKKNVEVIQVGAISTRGDVIVDELIKPKYKIPQRTTKIHGIRNEDVENMPSFPEVHEELQSVFEGKTVVAYKVAFEQQVLARSCSIHKLPELKPKRWLCALKAYRAYRGFPESCPMPGAVHSAVDDCYALLDLLMEMARNPNPW